jgi:NitT/TauT family transport system substrate-binding protein
MQVRFRIAAALVVAAVLAAASASAKDKVRLVDSQGQIYLDWGMYEAQTSGYYEAENLEASIIVGRGGADSLQAVITGSQDIVFGTGILGVVGAYSKGAPVTIIGSTMYGAAEVFWYVKSDSPIKSLKDLDGKGFAYTNPGSLSHMLAQTISRELGIKPKLISTGNLAATRTQLMSGQTDTAWSAFPSNLELVRAGEIRIIGTGNDAVSMRELTTRVTVANTAWLAKNRDVAVRAMRALWKGQQKAMGDAGAYDRFAAHWKVPVEDARKVPEFYRLDRVKFFPIGGLDETLRLAQEYGFIKEPLSDEQRKGLVTVVYDPDR